MSFSAKRRGDNRNKARVHVSDQVFQNAYARVRGRHTDESWCALSAREVTDSIYREIRIIDSERLLSGEAGVATMAMAAE
jgi:hypothetical protein